MRIVETKAALLFGRMTLLKRSRTPVTVTQFNTPNVCALVVRSTSAGFWELRAAAVTPRPPLITYLAIGPTDASSTGSEKVMMTLSTLAITFTMDGPVWSAVTVRRAVRLVAEEGSGLLTTT